MKTNASTFLHILAFQCPRCERPIVESVLSSMRNLESIDSAVLNLRCSCGWTDGRLGAQARRHLVLPWSASNESSVGDPEESTGDLDSAQEESEEDTLNTL
jgi:hypothetical protein